MNNIDCLVLDAETLFSADDCRHCGTALSHHYADGACVPWEGERPEDDVTQFSAIGWHNRPALGLSIGFSYWYGTRRMEPFDATGVETLLTRIVQEEPFVVGFNHAEFDMVLLRGLLRRHADTLRLAKPSYVPGAPDMPASMEEFATAEAFGRYQSLTDLCDRVKAYCQGPRCYDVLLEIWSADPSSKKVKGLNGLDAIARANGLGATVESGALMPQYWRDGKYASVILHCMADVKRTVLLLEMALRGEPLQRLDYAPVRLAVPEALQVWWDMQPRRQRGA